MGMYTRFTFWAEIPEATFNYHEFLNGITELRYGAPFDSQLPMPKHDLFTKNNRHKHAFRSRSYYFITNLGLEWRFDTAAKTYFLTLDCSFKNYDNEIKDFLNWIKPYVVLSTRRTFMGFWQYEEDETPTLIYFEKYQPKPFKHDIRILEIPLDFSELEKRFD